MPEASANIGVVGLAVMGSNLARNLASREGNTVAIFNRSYAKTDRASSTQHPEAGFIPAPTRPRSSPASLRSRARAIIMVKAGARHRRRDRRARRARSSPATSSSTAATRYFTDTIRRESGVRERGLQLRRRRHLRRRGGRAQRPLDHARRLRRSPAMTLGPILEVASPRIAEGEPRACTHVGPDGAGHFVKMVHNGIEYADMQLIARGVRPLPRRHSATTPVEIADVFTEWNKGDARVLPDRDHRRGAAPDRRRDRRAPRRRDRRRRPAPKGTGAWTVQTALSTGRAGLRHRRGRSSPARLSSHPEQRAAGIRTSPAPTRRSPSRPTRSTPSSRTCASALYASKIVAYAQGFDQIARRWRRVRLEHRSRRDLAKIWRGGCIIRAQFLNRIADAYAAEPEPAERC